VTGYLFHRLDAPFASRGQHIAPLRVVCADRARARARVSQEFFVVTNWTLVSRVAGGGVSQEAFVVTNRTLITLTLTLTLSLASQEELDAKRKDMNEQKEKEALLAAKVAAVEEKQLNVEETYSSLQDEADAKTRKLKKLFAKFQTVAETIQGIREEQQREREEMLDTARTLTRQVGSTSHARNPFNLNFFDSAQCLMVRRWRLIGCFPILYNPPGEAPPAPQHRRSVNRYCVARGGRVTHTRHAAAGSSSRVRISAKVPL
jgi:hypothetical protein